MEETVSISYGVMYPSIEEQIQKQGYTLGDKAEKLESYRKALITLRFGLDVPDHIYDNLLKRLQKQVISTILENKKSDVKDNET